MRPKQALERVALVDECERAEAVASALAVAGYDVKRSPDGVPADDVDFVVRVVPCRSRSALADTSSDPMNVVAQLAGGVAHEFNNLLAVISICADELLEGEGNDVYRTCLRDIRHAVERGAIVTRDLLAFSRRDIHQLRNVPLARVLSSAERMIARILGDDIAFRIELVSHGAAIRADPSEWPSVFVNLALNARQAMADGGAFTIQTRELTLDPATRGRPRPAGSYVEIAVSDTGAGIAPEIQPRIFEPFFTTRPKTEAHGLGLSVVHGVVERSGGWIEVESELGRGTTFRIFVPTAPPEPGAEPRTAATVVANGTILLVEDEDAVRRIAHRTLERNGFTVLGAASAEEALTIADTLPSLDLLVSDVVLPQMDGRRLAERIVLRHPESRVLFTSGYIDDTELRRRAAEEGWSFLPKPYTTKELIEEVRQLLAQRAAR